MGPEQHLHEAGQPGKPLFDAIGAVPGGFGARQAKGFRGAIRADPRTECPGEKADSLAVTRLFSTPNRGMQLAYSAGVMKILHHRATRHFIALLVGCRCGKKFLQRLDRPVVACLTCGRTDDLGRIIEKLREAREAERRRAPKAARRAKIRAA